MITYILVAIVSFPLILFVALWLSAQWVSTPWRTTAEAGVRLLYFTALRLQALAEAVDSGLVCYRDATTRPISPHCEMHRQIREQAEQDLLAERNAVARLRTV